MRTADLWKIVKGISFSWVRFFLIIVIGIIQTPILFKNLSKTELDFWYIFYAFGAFLQLADLGLVQTISRLIAYLDNSVVHKEKNQTVEKLTGYPIIQIYSTTLISFLLILFLVGFIAFGTYYLLYYNQMNSNKLLIAFAIYVLGIIFTLSSNVPAAILIGFRDVGTDSVIRSATQLLYFFVLYFFLSKYKSIIFVAIVFMLQNFLQLIVLDFVLKIRKRNIFGKKGYSIKLFQFNIAKIIYTQSFPLVINQLGGWLISQGNIFLASLIVGTNKISDYTINQQLFTYTIAISLVVNQSISPFIAKQYIESKLSNLYHLFTSVMIVCLVIVGNCLVVLLTCGENLISMWVGEEHYLGDQFYLFFALIAFLEVQHSVAGNFIWNIGSWPFNKWTLMAGLLTVVLGYILGKMYGLLGITIAAFLSKLVTINWYVVYFTLIKLKVGIFSYIKDTLAPILAGGVLLTLGISYFKPLLLTFINNQLLLVLLIAFFSVTVFSLSMFYKYRNSLLKAYKLINFPKV